MVDQQQEQFIQRYKLNDANQVWQDSLFQATLDKTTLSAQPASDIEMYTRILHAQKAQKAQKVEAAGLSETAQVNAAPQAAATGLAKSGFGLFSKPKPSPVSPSPEQKASTPNSENKQNISNQSGNNPKK